LPRIQRSAEVTYSAEQMFELVNDVASYPKFLPWCREARVLASGDGWVRARVAMAKGALQHAFTTRNELEWGRRIRIRLEDGPFKRLEGDWRFEPTQRGCRVSLDLEFEFAGRMLSAVLGPVFNQIASTLVDSFVRRADEVYGQRR
jgi:ribosome-associated toxin RatA of RatAB toxin-antitoxin module